MPQRKVAAIFAAAFQGLFLTRNALTARGSGFVVIKPFVAEVCKFSTNFSEIRTVAATLSLTKSEVYLLFDFCLRQIKHAI